MLRCDGLLHGREHVNLPLPADLENRAAAVADVKMVVRVDGEPGGVHEIGNQRPHAMMRLDLVNRYRSLLPRRAAERRVDVPHRVHHRVRNRMQAVGHQYPDVTLIRRVADLQFARGSAFGHACDHEGIGPDDDGRVHLPKFHVGKRRASQSFPSNLKLSARNGRRWKDLGNLRTVGCFTKCHRSAYRLNCSIPRRTTQAPRKRLPLRHPSQCRFLRAIVPVAAPATASRCRTRGTARRRQSTPTANTLWLRPARSTAPPPRRSPRFAGLSCPSAEPCSPRTRSPAPAGSMPAARKTTALDDAAARRPAKRPETPPCPDPSAHSRIRTTWPAEWRTSSLVFVAFQMRQIGGRGNDVLLRGPVAQIDRPAAFAAKRHLGSIE